MCRAGTRLLRRFAPRNDSETQLTALTLRCAVVRPCMPAIYAAAPATASRPLSESLVSAVNQPDGRILPHAEGRRGHARHGAMVRRQAGASRRAGVLPHGRLLRAVLRR